MKIAFASCMCTRVYKDPPVCVVHPAASRAAAPVERVAAPRALA